jgi:hypothetical protein
VHRTSADVAEEEALDMEEVLGGKIRKADIDAVTETPAVDVAASTPAVDIAAEG